MSDIFDSLLNETEPQEQTVGAVKKATRGRTIKSAATPEECEGPFTLLALEIHGYERILFFQFSLNPTGLTIIHGANENGKSSLLHSVATMFLGGSAASEMPVNIGADKADIIGTVQGPIHKYQIKRIVFPNRSTEIEVVRDDGSKMESAASWVKSLVGSYFYDPLAFFKMKDPDQINVLRDLLGLDFTAVDEEIALLEQDRLVTGRLRDTKIGHANSLQIHEGVPKEIQSAEGLAAEFTRISKANEEVASKTRVVDRLETARSEMAGRLTILDEQNLQLEIQITALKEKMDANKVKIETQTEELAEFDEKLKVHRLSTGELKMVDTADISKKMEDLEELNSKIRHNQLREVAINEADTLVNQYNDIDGNIKQKRIWKKEQIAACTFPVQGLSMDESGCKIMYNDIPLAMASDSVRKTVSTAIVAAKAGPLNLALLDDIEQYDTPHLMELNRVVTECGGQLVGCKVVEPDWTGEGLRIVDGAAA